MTYGLLVKNENGQTIIGPETFTVRMVESKAVNVGRINPGQTVKVPFSSEVTANMFAQLVPLWRRKVVAPNIEDPYQLEISLKTTWGDPIGIDAYPGLPGVSVGNGYVLLKGSSQPNSYTLGHVAIYVMTYI